MPPPLVTRFSSADHLQEAMRGIWNVEITQSEAGALDMPLWARQIDDCQLLGSATNRALVCSGRRSEAQWTITPITPHCAGGRFRGQTLQSGDLLLLDPGGEVFQQIEAGHRQSAISLPVALARRIIQAEYRCEPDTLLQHWSRQSDPRVSAQLARMLWHLLSGGSLTSMLGNATPADLASHIIALTQAGAVPTCLRERLAHRRRIVARAEEMIRSRLDTPPSITELCEATHASRRLLFYAFQELLGRSPSAHIKILRLHSARRRIIAGDTRPRVQEVAMGLGFLHTGQFAVDYYRLFGERPSQTRPTSVRAALERPLACRPDQQHLLF